jgi:L-ascorbate metabolism protein UlaG (beta-lactamase superfamily)
MIVPVQKGQALLRDIQESIVAPGELAVWWLGQSGYAFKTARTLFFVDLYLSEHLTHKYANTEKPHIRMTESPLRGHEITFADLVFSSHKHSDHLDPGTLPDLFTASPQARLVLPAALVDHAVSMGLERDRLIPTTGDETLTFDALTVHVLPSAHPGLDVEDSSYLYIGFVFEADGVRWYHSGDTVVYDGLAARLRTLQPDIVFLPINGTDERRHALKVPPNMNMDEAAALAQQVDTNLLIPHHYDMFTFNTVDVTNFKPDVPHRVLHCGEKFIWRKTQ